MQIHSAQRFSLNIHIFLVLVMVAERPPVASCTTSHQLSHPIVLGSPQQASKRVLEGLKDNKAFGRTASLGKTGQDITTSASVGCKDFLQSQEVFQTLEEYWWLKTGFAADKLFRKNKIKKNK